MLHNSVDVAAAVGPTGQYCFWDWNDRSKRGRKPKVYYESESFRDSLKFDLGRATVSFKAEGRLPHTLPGKALYLLSAPQHSNATHAFMKALPVVMDRYGIDGSLLALGTAYRESKKPWKFRTTACIFTPYRNSILAKLAGVDVLEDEAWDLVFP